MRIVQCDRCPKQASYRLADLDMTNLAVEIDALCGWHRADPWLDRGKPLALVDLCPTCFAAARSEDVFDFSKVPSH
jgi:hypothetical protein